MKEYIQEMPQIQAAATLVATGFAGSVVNAWAELNLFLDMSVKFGNAALIFMGVYLAYQKIKGSKRRDRRKEDSNG
tara:strand:- start:8415 stop:8642 length:228 start_codon:yes stop_codon:yes gene_type:complete